MKLIFLLGLAAVLALSVQAQAACVDGETLFACTTTKGKQVEVCDSGNVIRYSFGRPGVNPEMALAIPRDQASTYQWNGIGRSMNYSVRIPNGNAVYEVFSSTDRMGDDFPTTAGINVEVGGRQVTSLECRAETLVNNLEGVALREVE